MKDRSAVDILETVQRNTAIVPYRIGVHALSGYGTVGSYNDVGKGKAFKVLCHGYFLQVMLTQSKSNAMARNWNDQNQSPVLDT